MERFYSLEKLIEHGKTLVKDVETVSFDLFDTLLIRRIHDPDLVKIPVARYIAERSGEHGRKWSVEKVQQLRDKIEDSHREKTGLQFDDLEACYPDFMREVLETIFQQGMNDELFSDVAEYEIRMENSMLVPRKPLIQWLHELRKEGKQILVISDIYLPAEYLEKFIAHAGFLELVDGVVSSADSFLAKASGKAFPLIEKRFSIDKKKWLHIGDNPHSDGMRPDEYGLKSLVLLDAGEKQRKAIMGKYFAYGLSLPFWRGRALQQLMQPLEGENTHESALYREGYQFLGPLIAAFVQEVAEQCKKKHVGKIFFLSREGWTFKKVWEASVPFLFPDGKIPEIEYLYVSRLALAGASCTHSGLTKEKTDVAFLPFGNRDFRDICRIFALQADPFVKILEEYGIAVDTPLSAFHEGYRGDFRVRFNEMLKDESFQEEVKRQTAPSNQALQNYLDEVGFFSCADVALVDIGWLGSIQRFFYDAVKHRSDCPRINGFLFGATRGVPFPTTPENNVQGIIYDRLHFNFGASAMLYARDLFEEVSRAPHPTLIAYKLKENGYELVFRTVEDANGKEEQLQNEYFAPLQQGIFDAAARFGSASALLGFSLNDYRAWFNYLLIVKLAFPRSKELERLRYKYHLDDFQGTNKPIAYYKAPKELWDLSGLRLKLNPFLRPWLFYKHMRARLQEF